MKLLTFEGIDGAGKTTLIRNLKRILEKVYMEVDAAKEPFGTFCKSLNRDYSQFSANRSEESQLTPESFHNIFFKKDSESKETHMRFLTKMYLFSQAMRSQELNFFRTEYDYILLDRFYDSTYVYQHLFHGVSHGLLLSTVEKLRTLDTNLPYKTFLLDIPAEKAFARMTKEDQECLVQLARLKD